MTGNKILKNIKAVTGSVPLLVVVALMLMSCSKSEERRVQRITKDKFMSQSALGVYDSDAPKVVFNSDCQIAFNTSRHMFRLQADNQSYFAEITMSEFPSENSVLRVGVKMRDGAGSAVSEFSDDVLVVAVRDNTFWLWSDATSIGYIVMIEP